MKREVLSVVQKALTINLDRSNYGSFAEIGAGQEVVRNFFHAGGAAGTIAQSRSAYDMKVSDKIYGREGKRYVCESRLKNMLNTEHQFLMETLAQSKSPETLLFAFADTVTTRSYSNPENECHGWLGVRWQRIQDGTWSEVIIHVRLLDIDYHMQQEAVGIVGVNLIYGVLYYLAQPNILAQSLIDNLTHNRVEIDTVKCIGPACAHIDNQLLNLHLVHVGLTPAIIFNPAGEIELPAEILYKKPVLVQRGSFRPITHVNMDMQRCALTHFMHEPQVIGQQPVILMEIALSNLASTGEIDEHDFLSRVNLVTSLGHSVLISNFALHYQFARFISRNSKSFFVFVIGVANLYETMREEYYKDLDGGILEAFGKLFAFGGKLYIYPQIDNKTNQLFTSANIDISPRLRHLYNYLIDNQYIEDLLDCDTSLMSIFSKDVLEMIRKSSPGWEKFVPTRVVELIKEKKLWAGIKG
jgi:hypothetical protein